jgi:hypothetical protein
MKQSLFLLLFAVLFTAFNAGAQHRFSEATYPQFSVGVGPLSLLTRTGKINLNGSWNYASNKSVRVLLQVPVSTRVPNLISDEVDLSTGDVVRNTFRSSGLVVEHRFYPGNRAPAGFFLAPYFRYSHYGLRRDITNPETDFQTRIRGRLAGAGVGGAAGFQFKMGKRWGMDLTLAGVDIKWMGATLWYSTNNPDKDVQALLEEVQQSVADIPLIGDKLLSVVEGESVKARIGGVVLPGYRFNLAVNYIF